MQNMIFIYGKLDDRKPVQVIDINSCKMITQNEQLLLTSYIYSDTTIRS